jgi:tryptophan halogenase
VLFNDRALALQVPYARENTPIPSYTVSTAREAGWIWDIGLHQRRGTGYVYSSRHTSDARAEQVLLEYLGPAANGLSPRLLKLLPGYREQPWVGNCVAIGLSGGFLEPLESSGIGLIETAAYLVSYLFPFDGAMQPVARRFNTMMRERYERVVEFLKMHYALSRRTDSAYWRDNTDAATIPEGLREKLSMWRSRAPHRLDFIADHEMYQVASWQFVLYGMEFETRLAGAGHDRPEDARREFETLRALQPRAVADLPDHRQYVEHLCQRAGASRLEPAGA